MAFSKIVGFEVTPRRPSPPTFWPSVEVTPEGSAPIFRARPPESINARRMLSYQMLCPSFSISINGFMNSPYRFTRQNRLKIIAQCHLTRDLLQFLLQ